MDSPRDDPGRTAHRVRLIAAGHSGGDWTILLPVFAACLLFAARNSNFGFDPPGWLDPFIYVGYFWHYPDHLPFFERDYKGARLAWILPGFVAHRLLPEVAASYLVHGVTLASGGVALYLLLRETVKDKLIAAVLSVAWVSLTFGHGVGGWNYHALAGASYYLLACWLVVRAASAGRARTALIAGIVLACAVSTNVLFVLFLPLLAALYFTALPAAGREVRRVARDAGLVLAGVAALSVAFAVINRSTGGVWLFFLNDLQHSLQLGTPGNNEWWAGAAGWLPRALYLVIPVAAFVGGTTALFWRRRAGDLFGAVFVVQGWLGLAAYTWLQFARQQTTLDPNYFSFGLYCLAFPALAVILDRTRPRPADRRTDAWVIAAAVVMCLGSLLVGMPDLLPRAIDRSIAFAAALPLALLPLVIGVGVLAVVPALPRAPAVLLFSAWFSLTNVWVAVWVGSPRSYGINTPGIQRSMLELIREADGLTTGLDPSLGRIKYWFEHETVETSQGPVDLSRVFDSYVATRGWTANLLAGMGSSLALDAIAAEHLENVSCIGFLSSAGAHAERRSALLAHLERIGVRAPVVAERTFQRPDLSFSLTVVRLLPADAVQLRAWADTVSCRY